MKKFVFSLFLSFSLLLTGCAYLKRHTQPTSFEQNQCQHLKREQAFLGHQYGQKSVAQISTRRMQLARQYDKLNCDALQ